jgi:hypothetical protein
MESRLPQMPIECEEIVNPTNSVGLYPASIPLGRPTTRYCGVTYV